jgi:serine/threonine protein kinase
MSSSSKMEEIFRESKTLRLLGHRNIISLFHFFLIDKYAVLIMEFCSGGELYHYLKEKGKLDEIEGRRIIMQVCHAVHTCH